jgi:hypothetical protein
MMIQVAAAIATSAGLEVIVLNVIVLLYVLY